MVIALFQQLRSRLTAPRLAAIVAAIVFVSGACVRADVTAPLRVQLRWLHQAQFAGYYVAEANTSRGLGDSEFELVAGVPRTGPLGRLVKGEVDVAILWLAEALQARAGGADIVNVAQIFRRPGMALACNKTAAVRGAADLAGRAVGVWNIGDEILVHLWLRRARVPDSSVQFLQQDADGRDLVSGRVPCATVMLYNEHCGASCTQASSQATSLSCASAKRAWFSWKTGSTYGDRSLDDAVGLGVALADFVKAARTGLAASAREPRRGLDTHPGQVT